LTERENEIVIKKIVEAWNRHDQEAFMSHLSDDVTIVWPSGRTVDKEGLRKEFDYSTFPDSSWRVDRMVSQGDTVWVEYTFTGTQKGAWFRIPATNKKVEYQLVMIFDFEAGKIKLWKVYWDRLRFFKQIQEQAVAEFWDKMRK